MSTPAIPVSEIESTVPDTQDPVFTLRQIYISHCNTTYNKKLREVQSLISSHAEQLEDMENRFRRNNVWAVGIPEKTEGKNPAFIEHWLVKAVGREVFSLLFVVEQARVPGRLPHPREPPRPFLLKFLNFKDRDTTEYQARTRGMISRWIMFTYPSTLTSPLTYNTKRNWAKFTEVKKHLRMSAMQCYIQPDCEWLPTMKHTF